MAVPPWVSMYTNAGRLSFLARDPLRVSQIGKSGRREHHPLARGRVGAPGGARRDRVHAVARRGSGPAAGPGLCSRPVHFAELTDVEQRVLGCLIEKQLTTPQQYPLSLNALTLACNQASNRDPVVSYDDVTTESSGEGVGRRITVLPRD